MTPTDLRTLPHEELVDHVRSLIVGTARRPATPRLPHTTVLALASVTPGYATHTSSNQKPLKENTS